MHENKRRPQFGVQPPTSEVTKRESTGGSKNLNQRNKSISCGKKCVWGLDTQHDATSI